MTRLTQFPNIHLKTTFDSQFLASFKTGLSRGALLLPSEWIFQSPLHPGPRGLAHGIIPYDALQSLWFQVTLVPCLAPAILCGEDRCIMCVARISQVEILIPKVPCGAK